MTPQPMPNAIPKKSAHKHVRHLVRRRNALGRRRREKAAHAAARKAKARLERRRLLRITHRNDLVLMERYRTIIRAQTIDTCRRNVDIIAKALPEIVELKRMRIVSIVRLINANVAIMTEQLHKVLQKTDEIFAQNTPPIDVSLEGSQRQLRAQLYEMYKLFRASYHFEANESTMLERKFSRSSRDFFALPLPVASNPSETASANARGKMIASGDETNEINRESIVNIIEHRDNLIAIIEQEEIRTIAAQQTLHEKIDAIETQIAALTLRIAQASGKQSENW